MRAAEFGDQRAELGGRSDVCERRSIARHAKASLGDSHQHWHGAYADAAATAAAAAVVAAAEAKVYIF
jgi:hypothetical protein